MNGIIGAKHSAKFFFINCEDEKQIPHGREMSHYFPNHEMHIYKSGGHFSESFRDIQNSLEFIRFGGKFKNRMNVKNDLKHITHAIRLNPACNRNIFFDLKYGDIVIDSLHLSYESLERLSSILENIKEIESAIRETIRCKHHFNFARDVAIKLLLNDPKIFTPNQQSIDNLFDEYGDLAIQQLIERLKDWHQSVLWV